MITEKTLFVNKKFNKYHKLGDRFQKRVEKNNKIGIRLAENLIFYKYKNYFIEAPLFQSKQFFELLFFHLKDKNDPSALKNFSIETVYNEDTYENKENDDMNIYFNKYQIMFFLFLHQCLELFQKMDEDLEKIIKKIELETRADFLNKKGISYTQEDLINAYNLRKEKRKYYKKSLLFKNK